MLVKTIAIVPKETTRRLAQDGRGWYAVIDDGTGVIVALTGDIYSAEAARAVSPVNRQIHEVEGEIGK